MTALFGGTGLWNAWPVAEAISLLVSFMAFRKYKDRYGYM